MLVPNNAPEQENGNHGRRFTDTTSSSTVVVSSTPADSTSTAFNTEGCSSQESVSSASSDDECSTTADRGTNGGLNTENQQKPFPQALMDLLSQEDPDIVTWLPSGKAFIVRCPKKFVELVLPRFFKQTRITSFQRQLNMYGFRRIADGPDMGAYHHELFVRDKPDLCSTIQRKKRIRKRAVPKSSPAATSSIQCTPSVSAAEAGRTATPSQDFSPSLALPSTACLPTSDISRNEAPINACQSMYPSPSPSLASHRSSLKGFSIIVCDHANKSIAEVAHYATIPCDLESFALGVGGLLADGIEQYKKSCANNVAMSTSLSEKYPPIPQNTTTLHTYCEDSYNYSEAEMDVDICTMFKTESFSNFHMTAC